VGYSNDLDLSTDRPTNTWTHSKYTCKHILGRSKLIRVDTAVVTGCWREKQEVAAAAACRPWLAVGSGAAALCEDATTSRGSCSESHSLSRHGPVAISSTKLLRRHLFFDRILQPTTNPLTSFLSVAPIDYRPTDYPTSSQVSAIIIARHVRFLAG
jgi:hypothetical protein